LNQENAGKSTQNENEVRFKFLKNHYNVRNNSNFPQKSKLVRRGGGGGWGSGGSAKAYKKFTETYTEIKLVPIYKYL